MSQSGKYNYSITTSITAISTPTHESEEAHSGLCGCLSVDVSEQTCLKSIFYKHYCAKLTWSHSVWRNPWQNTVLSQMAEYCFVTNDRILFCHKWQNTVLSQMTEYCFVTNDRILFCHKWQNTVLSQMAEFILKTTTDCRSWRPTLNQYVKPQKIYICNSVSQYLTTIATHLLSALKNHCNIPLWDPCRFPSL